MKREIILTGLFLFALIGFSGSGSAAHGCNGFPNQNILNISGATNAHGEVWNEGNYNVDICYNDLFGVEYPDQDPHVCDGLNLVLNLSAQTNAHAEVPPGANYVVGVCYGDLVCRSIPGNQNCDIGNGEIEVVSLSAETNAHLEKADSNIYTGSSNRKICCSSAFAGLGAVKFTDLRWEDFFGNEINESYVNRTVKLIAETTFSSGTEITFEIWEEDPFLNPDDPIRTLSNNNALIGTVDSQGIAIAPWRITDDDMKRGADCVLGVCSEPNPWEFYFIASSGGVINDSREFDDGTFNGILYTNNIEGNNTFPTANITGELVHRGIYFTGIDIEFNHSSFDLEGPIVSFEWTIENSAGIELTKTDESFDYAFTTQGQKTITLRVTDERGEWDEDQIAVLAIESPGIFAFINKPFHREIVVNESLVVKLDASDSYVVDNNYDKNTCQGTIDCLAGNCPIQTQNWPSCTNNPITVRNPQQGFSSLNFSWKFDDGDEFSGFGNVSGEKPYAIASTSLTDNKIIDLLLSYNSQEEVSTKRIFILLDQSQCIDGGTFWIEDPTGRRIRHSTMNSNACGGPNGVIGGGDDCCPVGFTCTEEGCRRGPNPPDSCSDYTNRTDCNNDTYSVASIDPLRNQIGCDSFQNGSVIRCECLWNGTSEFNGECALTKISISGGGPGTSCVEYQCLYIYNETECTGGYMTINVQTQFIQGGPTCTTPPLAREECLGDAQTYVIPCGQINFELGFFDMAQFFAAVIAIFIIYFLISPGRRKR